MGIQTEAIRELMEIVDKKINILSEMVQTVAITSDNNTEHVMEEITEIREYCKALNEVTDILLKQNKTSSEQIDIMMQRISLLENALFKPNDDTEPGVSRLTGLPEVKGLI